VLGTLSRPQSVAAAKIVSYFWTSSTFASDVQYHGLRLTFRDDVGLRLGKNPDIGEKETCLKMWQKVLECVR